MPRVLPNGPAVQLTATDDEEPRAADLQDPADHQRVGVAAPGDELERFMYGWSITTCLPDGRSREASVATGTVMRPDTLRGYARDAGFGTVEILPIENDFFRFYRLTR